MEIMKFDSVRKEFKDGDEIIQALKPTSFSIDAGQLVAVIGPSGSGKSTMLTMMGGLQSPTSGTITFDGKTLSEMKEKERNNLRFNEIGFILQASNLVPFLTVEEQFRFVDKFAGRPYQQERAEALMKRLDVDHRKNNYPDDLSGGERQRVAICRALYNEPKLILADEPTASLDTERTINVVKLMRDLTKENNVSTVMVTHDTRLLKYCDRAFQVLDGVVTEKTDNLDSIN